MLWRWSSFLAQPRGDMKPLAKSLLEVFGSLAEVIRAPEARLREVKGVGDVTIDGLKVVAAAAQRIAEGEIQAQRRAARRWNDVTRLLPHRHGVRRQGAVPHPVPRQAQPADRRRSCSRPAPSTTPRSIPREVDEARAGTVGHRVILVHNHPSGDPTPSRSRYPDDQGDRRHRQAARHFRARSRHRRQRTAHASLKGLRLISPSSSDTGVRGFVLIERRSAKRQRRLRGSDRAFERRFPGAL